MNDIVTVIAMDKGTGFIKTCTSCDRNNAEYYAKYYRSIGYRSRIVTEEILEIMLNKEQSERMLNN